MTAIAPVAAPAPSRPLRIGFNGHRLAGQRLGVGRYIEYMLRYWSEYLEPSEELTLFLRREFGAADRVSSGIAGRVRTRVIGADISGIPWENLWLRGAAAAETDVLFCPAYTAPVAYRGRLVVATHSVNESRAGAHPWWYMHTYSRLHGTSARQADAVIVPCRSIGDTVAEFYGVSPSAIHVVEQGSDDCFQPMAPDDPALRQVRERFFGADRPFILFAGKSSTRRNIPMLLRAFAQLRREQHIPHGLLLFGPNPDGLPLAELCAELGIADSVVQTDGKVASHRELVPIYNAAELFVHPSAMEGWSMTTIEAMACGTAVVAVNRGGLGEVANGHALMIEEPSVDALADAIGRVLGSGTLRQELERKAFARGDAIRWKHTTRQTLDVVRSVG